MAIGLSLGLQVLVVYVPFLQQAFGTVGLPGGDWIVCVAVASSVVWLTELKKVLVRTRRR